MFSVNNSWVYLCGAGCPVGSNHFVGEPLCVAVPIRVVRVFLGDVTCSWSTFVLGGGGGNVTFRGIQVPRNTLYIIIPLYLRALVRCDVVRCQGILV